MEKKKVKIYVGMPTTGEMLDTLFPFFRALEAKYKDEVELVYPKHIVRRIFHDFARNSIVEEFLASDCDILWFLDSDVEPPDNILDMVTKQGHLWDAAGAPYPVFMTVPGDTTPAIVFTVYQGDGSRLHAANIPSEGQEFVSGVATGCMFLKRKVFEKLEKPYFEFKYESDTRKMIEGEDLGFCLKLNSLGYRFYVDYSMLCRHMKRVCLLEVSTYAVKYAKKSVLAYDRDIRGKVERFAKAASQGQINPASSSTSKIILPSFYKGPR